MDTAALEFLKKIIETPSPSGYERPVQEIVRQYVAGFADKVTTDSHGNVIAVKNPGGAMRVMLAGHCDQIGLLVQYIDAEGYISCQSIGGWDPMQLIGQRMVIWTSNGPLPGVIARKAIHLLTEEERKQVPKLKDLWLDIGAKDKAEAEELVRIGDPVTLQLSFQPLRNNLANSPAMDDKCGLWVVIEALRRASLKQARIAPCSPFPPCRRRSACAAPDQRLRHRSARRHRRRRDSRHRLPHDRQEARGRHRVRQGPGDLSRPEHEPRRRRAAARNGASGRGALSTGRQRPRHADRRQRACKSRGPASPPALVSIPNRYMHSAGGNDLAARHRPRRRPARRICPAPHRPGKLHALSGAPRGPLRCTSAAGRHRYGGLF